jgi:cysteine-rich repeat protein
MYAIPAVGLVFGSCGGVETGSICGDGIVAADEECDDGNADDSDDCPSSCEVARCNDGFVLADVEECDDRNNVDGDDCTNACTVARCGDGVVFDQETGTETCDDANAVDTDGCSTACELDPVLRAFELTTVRNAVQTDVDTYQLCTSSGYGGCYAYTACNRVFDSPLSISAVLQATGGYSRSRDCADNPSDLVITRTLSGVVQVITFRQKYRISLVENTAALVLDCDMDQTAKLTCKDGQMLNWVLEPK